MSVYDFSSVYILMRNISLYSPSARKIEVEEIAGSRSIFVQSDGEYLGFLPRQFSILPGAIEMIC